MVSVLSELWPATTGSVSDLGVKTRRLEGLKSEGSVSLTSPASGSRYCRFFANMGYVHGSGELLGHRSLREGEEDRWLRWRLGRITSSGGTRISVIGCGGLVRRRQLGRGGETRGALTVKISTRVFLQPPRRTRSRACRC
ncbi:hypothetical protein Bca101_017303 [Brassica carinata]